MNHEQQLNDKQLAELMTAVLVKENRIKNTGRNMTIREINTEFANTVGGIKVEFLSRGDGAALRELVALTSGSDRKSAKRNTSALLKLLTKEQKRRSRHK
jgi:hypothetical protein